jgi:hypothetical protein
MWLDKCQRAGIVVLPPDAGWRAGLIAADVVVGDHGSVTFYGAALGRPVLLATWPVHLLDPASPIGQLVAKADRLDAGSEPAAMVLDALRAGENPELRAITAMVSSAPGQAARLLRAELYRWLHLPEPPENPPTWTIPVPTVPAIRCAAQVVRAQLASGVVAVTRYPGELVDTGLGWPADGHLTVSTDEAAANLLQEADIVINERPGDARGWIADTLAALPGAVLASMPVEPGRWLVGGRDGTLVEVTGYAPDGRIWASVVHAWQGRRLPARVTVTLGRQQYVAGVRQLSC